MAKTDDVMFGNKFRMVIVVKLLWYERFKSLHDVILLGNQHLGGNSNSASVHQPCC